MLARGSEGSGDKRGTHRSHRRVEAGHEQDTSGMLWPTYVTPPTGWKLQEHSRGVALFRLLSGVDTHNTNESFDPDSANCRRNGSLGAAAAQYEEDRARSIAGAMFFKVASCDRNISIYFI